MTGSAARAPVTQREQAAAEARSRILAAAAERIVRDGLAQVRMASIARTAGVSAGLLHYHFDTKEQLFAAVLTHSHGISAELNQRAMARAGAEPAARLAAFLDRCLPSDEALRDEWLLWQELDLLCLRDRHLAKVGADLYEDLYATAEAIVTDGLANGTFRTTLAPRALAETLVALTDGLGGRVLADDPRMDLARARATLATTAGILTGHDGPLSAPREDPVVTDGTWPSSRRGFLAGGLALGASMTLPGCAYLRDDAPTDAPLPASAKAEIDGDLVYFNWADYLAPAVLRGFQEEYDVKIVESNFDSMEGMYAKIAAGNQYDIVFPIAKWVQKLRREGKLRAIDPDQLTNADQVFYSGSYFNTPWYDEGSRASVPFTVYKTGIGWRTDQVSNMTGSWRDLWNEQARGRVFTLDDQDETLAMAAILLDYDVNTSKPAELEEMKRLLISQKEYLRAYSSDDVNNMNGGDAWIHHMWSGDFLYLQKGLAENPESFAFEAPVEGTPINSDTYAIPTDARHPGTAMVFIDYLLRPENAVKNINYLYYPFPVRDAVSAFEELAAQAPACNVEVSDLENEDVFRLLGADEVQRRAAMWTEVKAS